MVLERDRNNRFGPISGVDKWNCRFPSHISSSLLFHSRRLPNSPSHRSWSPSNDRAEGVAARVFDGGPFPTELARTAALRRGSSGAHSSLVYHNGSYRPPLANQQQPHKAHFTKIAKAHTYFGDFQWSEAELQTRFSLDSIRIRDWWERERERGIRSSSF